MYNSVLKGVKDAMVDQIVKNTTRALEAMADKLWVPLAGHLILNMACWVRAEAEGKAHEEHDRNIQEEVEHLMQEKLMRAVLWEKQLEHKLTDLLVGWLTLVEFEDDSEAEESEVVGMDGRHWDDWWDPVISGRGGGGGGGWCGSGGGGKVRRDAETGTIVATQDVEEEGACSEGDTNTGRESGAGESGGVRECGEHGKAIREVHQAPDTMCGGWGWCEVWKLLGAHSCQWERWQVGGSRESDEVEGEEASHPR